MAHVTPIELRAPAPRVVNTEAGEVYKRIRLSAPAFRQGGASRVARMNARSTTPIDRLPDSRLSGRRQEYGPVACAQDLQIPIAANA
jgi:hypothetical protein